jgi:methylated-DNA-protein-cysteine methyltransferase-like protein
MEGFFKKVYQIVAQVPPGKVATYGQIAALLGEPRHARIVGWAMHDAPKELNLPCHRIVNKAGSLSPGCIFDPGAQRILLEKEGVTFQEDGHIDLKQHLWEPFHGQT